METGILIRANVDGGWQSLDIGDERIPDKEILRWLRSRGGLNVWAENCTLLLLGRKPISKEDETDYRLYCPCYSGGRCDHDGHMCLKDRGDVCSFWDNEQDEIRARKGE